MSELREAPHQFRLLRWKQRAGRSANDDRCVTRQELRQHVIRPAAYAQAKLRVAAEIAHHVAVSAHHQFGGIRQSIGADVVGPAFRPAAAGGPEGPPYVLPEGPPYVLPEGPPYVSYDARNEHDQPGIQASR